MTTLEQRFMETVPHKLCDIAHTLAAQKPRLVKVEEDAFVNPNHVTSVYKQDGCVKIDLGDEQTFCTSFTTCEEAIAALGLG